MPCAIANTSKSLRAWLCRYLEEELGDVEAHVARKPPMHHLPPFRSVRDLLTSQLLLAMDNCILPDGFWQWSMGTCNGHLQFAH